MVRMIGLIVFMATLLSLGVACLFFSDGIQRYAVKSSDNGLTPHIVQRFVRSNSYLVSVRMVGIIAILMFAIVLWGSILTN